MNSQTYMETFDFTPIIKNLLKTFEIPEDDDHIKRHNQEIKKKIEEFKKSSKRKDYFKEMPTLDTDFSSYVIRNII
jgi:exonuclease V gamma subunit